MRVNSPALLARPKAGNLQREPPGKRIQLGVRLHALKGSKHPQQILRGQPEGGVAPVFSELMPHTLNPGPPPQSATAWTPSSLHGDVPSPLCFPKGKENDC